MKKVLLTVLVLLVLVLNVYAGGSQGDTRGTVRDNNNGNLGQILVHSGEIQGEYNDVGTWTNSDFLKGEKGDNGLNGINGTNGRDGIDGQKGIDGINGLDGVDGINGKEGEQGIQGIQGDKGDIGLNGKNGVEGINGKEGEIGEEGKQGNKGEEGKEGKQGEKGLQGEQGKGLEDRVELILEGRILDTKNTTWSVYGGYDINNKINIIGLKCMIKFGKSYEETELEKTNKRLNRIENQLETNTIITRTLDSNGQLKSISIGNN